MPFCPDCGHQHADDDRFCARCGRALTAAAVPPAVPAPPPAPPVVQAPPVTVVQQPRSPAGQVPETVLWEGAPHGLLNPIETHAIHWVLTNERLRVVRGILSRSTEEVELMRVRDVSFEQSLAQRALGIGTITVLSTDESTPTVVLHDIEDPEGIHNLIRQAVREQRRRNRVRQVEADDPFLG